jgi:hypothetical protein
MKKKSFLLIIVSIIVLMLVFAACSNDVTDPTDTYDDITDPNDDETYNLRDTGPAGGIIFYDKGSYSDGWRYLEAAPQSTELTNKEWGKYGTLSGAAGTAIGTGKNNTSLIVAKLNEVPAESDRAAQLCDALEHEHEETTYSDWFLPSKDELYEMCWVLHSRRWNGSSAEDNPAYGEDRVGGLANGTYWSSSESHKNFAWRQYFTDGSQSFNNKDIYARVRAVRAF